MLTFTIIVHLKITKQITSVLKKRYYQKWSLCFVNNCFFRLLQKSLIHFTKFDCTKLKEKQKRSLTKRSDI